MSAPRPRPVTATIGKRPATGTFRAKKNVTLLSSSGGSTESLISCVDDDSANSSTNSGRSNKTADKSPHDSPKERTRRHSSEEGNSICSKDNSFSERIISEKSAITTVTSTEASTSEDNKEPEIGPWEKWMITKSESMKKLAQQKSRLERMKKQQAKQQEIERKEREKKAEHIRQDWLRQKNEDKLRAERRALLRQKRKQREDEERKKTIEEKAKEKYDEWIQQKKKADELRHALEVEEQKLKELELKDKKEKSDQAFKAWLEKSSQRIKPHPHTYAKCDGAITGYYDTAASPSPSYYNPVPWQPVALPTSQTKPSRKKNKCKKREVRNAWTIDN